MVSPSTVGREPDLGIAAGNDIVLDAHVRDEEIVQHVFAGHDELHRLVDWDVNIVDGADPSGYSNCHSHFLAVT